MSDTKNVGLKYTKNKQNYLKLNKYLSDKTFDELRQFFQFHYCRGAGK